MRSCKGVCLEMANENVGEWYLDVRFNTYRIDESQDHPLPVLNMSLVQRSFISV